MRLENIRIVAKREYLLRVKSKGFWIGTLVLPLLLTAFTVLPSLFLTRSRTVHQVVVVDETGRIAQEFAANPNGRQPQGEAAKKGERERVARFEVEVEPPAAEPAARKAQTAELDRRALAEEIDSWVWIGNGVLQGGPVEYHARSVSNFMTQEVLEDRLSEVVRRVRLAEAGYDPDKVGELSGSLDLKTVRISEEGSRAEGGIGSVAFAYILFFLLYTMMVIWGQQVMNGVLEEKGSRIVEVVLSSIQPFELMMGKLTGICLAGLTQFAVWLGTMMVVTAPGLLATLATLPEELVLPTVTLAMVLNYILLFVLGFFVYATMYAAIGAAFNNLQEAQQVAGIAVFFLIVPFMVMFQIINDPNSTLAVVTSLIPPFTPMLMTLRVSLDMPPAWQLLLGYALTIAFIWGMVWVCARIYRVGILMYGKKPTLQEIWRWVRYA
jgi:ABC-2 type transport system permease protein